MEVGRCCGGLGASFSSAGCWVEASLTAPEAGEESALRAGNPHCIKGRAGWDFAVLLHAWLGWSCLQGAPWKAEHLPPMSQPGKPGAKLQAEGASDPGAVRLPRGAQG